MIYHALKGGPSVHGEVQSGGREMAGDFSGGVAMCSGAALRGEEMGEVGMDCMDGYEEEGDELLCTSFLDQLFETFANFGRNCLLPNRRTQSIDFTGCRYTDDLGVLTPRDQMSAISRSSGNSSSENTPHFGAGSETLSSWTSVRREFYNNRTARERERERRKAKHRAIFGGKTIGPLGSYIYLINQIFGAGLLAVPFAVKACGWLPSLLANIFVCAISSLATLMMMRSMTMIEGNQNFEKRYEYIPTANYFLGKKYSSLIQIIFHISIQSLNLLSIVIVSQAIDHLLIRGLGFTAGLQLYPHIGRFETYLTYSSVDTLYDGSQGLVMAITLGYLFNAFLCIPLSAWNLEDNMRIQYLSFAFLMLSVSQMVISAIFTIKANSKLSSDSPLPDSEGGEAPPDPSSTRILLQISDPRLAADRLEDVQNIYDQKNYSQNVDFRKVKHPAHLKISKSPLYQKDGYMLETEYNRPTTYLDRSKIVIPQKVYEDEPNQFITNASSNIDSVGKIKGTNLSDFSNTSNFLEILNPGVFMGLFLCFKNLFCRKTGACDAEMRAPSLSNRSANDSSPRKIIDSSSQSSLNLESSESSLDAIFARNGRKFPLVPAPLNTVPPVEKILPFSPSFSPCSPFASSSHIGYSSVRNLVASAPITEQNPGREKIPCDMRLGLPAQPSVIEREASKNSANLELPSQHPSSDFQRNLHPVLNAPIDSAVRLQEDLPDFKQYESGRVMEGKPPSGERGEEESLTSEGESSFEKKASFSEHLSVGEDFSGSRNNTPLPSEKNAENIKKSRKNIPVGEMYVPSKPVVPGLFGNYQFSQLFSTFIASYSFVNVTPSWANEMTANVKVTKVVWRSNFFCCFVYYIFGILLATAYPDVDSDNILQVMLLSKETTTLTKFSIYVFDLFTLAPGILVYCITTRYNLVNSRVCEKGGAFFWGCIAPFLVSWMMACNLYFASVLTWSSLLFSLACNFIIPAILYVIACSNSSSIQPCSTPTVKPYYNPAIRKNIVKMDVKEMRQNLVSWLRSRSVTADPHIEALISSVSSPSGGFPKGGDEEAFFSVEENNLFLEPCKTHRSSSAGFSNIRQFDIQRIADSYQRESAKKRGDCIVAKTTAQKEGCSPAEEQLQNPELTYFGAKQQQNFLDTKYMYTADIQRKLEASPKVYPGILPGNESIWNMENRLDSASTRKNNFFPLGNSHDAGPSPDHGQFNGLLRDNPAPRHNNEHFSPTSLCSSERPNSLQGCEVNASEQPAEINAETFFESKLEIVKNLDSPHASADSAIREAELGHVPVEEVENLGPKFERDQNLKEAKDSAENRHHLYSRMDRRKKSTAVRIPVGTPNTGLPIVKEAHDMEKGHVIEQEHNLLANQISIMAAHNTFEKSWGENSKIHNTSRTGDFSEGISLKGDPLAEGPLQGGENRYKGPVGKMSEEKHLENDSFSPVVADNTESMESRHVWSEPHSRLDGDRVKKDRTINGEGNGSITWTGGGELEYGQHSRRNLIPWSNPPEARQASSDGANGKKIMRQETSQEELEDAYEIDEDFTTGELRPIRIHVFPPGFLRKHHVFATHAVIVLLILFSLASVGFNLVTA